MLLLKPSQQIPKSNVCAALNVWISIINCYKTICFAQHTKEVREGSERHAKITKFEYFTVQIHGKLQTTVVGVTTHALTRRS